MSSKKQQKRTKSTTTTTKPNKVVTKTKTVVSGPKLSKSAKKGRAKTALKNNKKTFQEMVVSDGLNRALQMHNNSSIVDHFPRRMEKVTDLTFSLQTFQNKYQYYLNPGNTELFPIFSKVAAVYEQYRCRFLRFHYVTEAYVASGSSFASGKLVMATNVDPDDPSFLSMTAMENYTGSDRTVPFSSMTHDPLGTMKKLKNKQGRSHMPLNEYFVYPSGNLNAPVNTATKFYDMGLFQMAASGLPLNGINTEIGELFVEYEFDMIRPRDISSVGAGLLACHVRELPGASSSAANPFGSNGHGVLATGSNINPTTSVSSGNATVAWPEAGNFFVNISFLGNTTSPMTVTNVSAAYGNFLPSTFRNDTQTFANTLNSGTGSSVSFIYTNFDSSGLGGFSFTIPAATSGNLDLWIIQIPSIIQTVSRLLRDDTDFDRKESEKVANLESQVKQLGSMFKALLVKIPDDGCLVVEDKSSRVPSSPVIEEKTAPVVKFTTPKGTTGNWF